MKRYAKYKDSGVEWIGDVPEGWGVAPLKRFCNVKRGSSPRPIDDPKFFDINGQYSWVRISDVTKSERYLISTDEKLSELGSSLSTKLEPNDLFLSIAGSVGKPIITKIQCCIHDGFVWFLNLTFHKEYLYYIFKIGQCFFGLGKMGTQLNLNSDTVGMILLPLPPLEEQKLIVVYLDEKTSYIDKLLDISKRKIGLLKEQRSSIINQVVTKGLNPNAKMKNSGVEWIGDIPEGWDRISFKYEIDILTDYTSNGSFKSLSDNVQYLELGYSRLVRLTDLRVNLTNDGIYVSENSHKYLKKSELFGGEILISCVGHYTGIVFKMLSGMGVCTLGPNMYLIKNKVKTTNVDFLVYLLNSDVIQFGLLHSINKTTQEKINKDNVKDLKILRPPLIEQEQIVSYLDEKTSYIDKSISIEERRIGLLKEYRQSIISQVITGKIKVIADE